MKKNNIFKMCFGIFKTTIKNFGSFIFNNYIFLTNVTLVMLPAVFVYCCTKSIELLITIPLLQTGILFTRKLFEILKSERDGFPVLNKRLTIKRNDEVKIKQGCLQEAIIYLSQVEDYTERCGYIKK